MFDLTERVHPDHTALLVVDVQNDYCHPDGDHGKRGNDLGKIQEMVPRLQQFLDEARKSGVTVIFVAMNYSQWTNSPSWLANRKRQGCRPNSWGADFYGVHPEGDEVTVLKHRFSAFVDTDLDLILRSRKMANLIVTGVNTNACVLSTALDAYNHDYFVTVAEDCCATTWSQDYHDAALLVMKDHFAHVATSREIIDSWQHHRQKIS